MNIGRTLDISIAIKESPLAIASTLNSRGNVHKYLKDYNAALADYERAYAIVEELGFELGIMTITASLGHVYKLKGEHRKALAYTLRAIEMMEASGDRLNIVENHLHAATTYAALGDYKAAFAYYRKYAGTKDSIFTEEQDRTLSDLRTGYETEKKEARIVTLEKEALLEQQARERNAMIRLLLIVLAVLLVILVVGLWHRLAFIRRSRAAIQQEKDISEGLLHNILPEEVAAELKAKGEAEARLIDPVTCSSPISRASPR